MREVKDRGTAGHDFTPDRHIRRNLDAATGNADSRTPSGARRRTFLGADSTSASFCFNAWISFFIEASMVSLSATSLTRTCRASAVRRDLHQPSTQH